MKISGMAAAFAVVSLLIPCNAITAEVQGDIAGGKDPPMVSRMPGFLINAYEEREFDAYEFTMGERSTTIEGHKYVIEYVIREGTKVPGELQITRNYTNAVRKIGGEVLYEEAGGGSAVMKVVRSGKESWIEVRPGDGAMAYYVVVVERGSMAQEVSANVMLDALNRDGHIALYINFDTGKATIRPESQRVIAQIAEMMKSNPSLAIGVEGHTDTVGDRARNKVLSEERAKAVVAALTRMGIRSERLAAAGFGQDRPIGDNATEEGRAKNRRVELVKRP